MPTTREGPVAVGRLALAALAGTAQWVAIPPSVPVVAAQVTRAAMASPEPLLVLVAPRAMARLVEHLIHPVPMVQAAVAESAAPLVVVAALAPIALGVERRAPAAAAAAAAISWAVDRLALAEGEVLVLGSMEQEQTLALVERQA